MESMEQQIEQVAELVSTSERIIFFTGAGVSTESGIPDFRGPDGIWSKYDPEDFSIDRFLSDSNVRKMHWEFLTSGQLNMTIYIWARLRVYLNPRRIAKTWKRSRRFAQVLAAVILLISVAALVIGYPIMVRIAPS